MALFKARTIPEIIPPVTKTYGPISIEQAYLAQDQLAVKLISLLGPVKGYKIGFASESVFEKLGISEPAYGRLYAHQIVEDDDTLSVADFFVFNIEAEVAFKVGKQIDKKIDTIEELKNYIESVHAAFDISNNWYDPKQGDQMVPDFIVNSGGSHYFVLGPPVDPNGVGVDNLVLKVLRAGETLYEGPSTAVLGSPWYIMKWIANHTLNRGYPLESGYVIFTGKVAPEFKATGAGARGTYVGDCGDLGVIKVTLK
ncbi:MAG: 2-keto-4-pentenoate hydratase [bacterium]